MLAIVICVGKVLTLLRVARSHRLRLLIKVEKYIAVAFDAPRRYDWLRIAAYVSNVIPN
jgi:hypothetical protein